MVTTENARKVLDDLVERLNSHVIARFIEKRLFSQEADIPMRKWSLLNQLVAFCSGTSDARGFRQWLAVGRHVKRGAHALYILVPMIRTTTDSRTNPETGDEEEETRERLSGFRAMPVFRVEDSEGEPLSYGEAMDAFDPSRFPLFDVARNLGLTVTKELTTSCYGYYCHDDNKIALGTDDVTTFFHELSHAVDFHLPAHNESYDFGECVAELSSCFLCHIYNLPHQESRTKAYIERYQGKAHVAFSMVHVIERVIAIYEHIASHTTATAPHSLPA